MNNTLINDINEKLNNNIDNNIDNNILTKCKYINNILIIY